MRLDDTIATEFSQILRVCECVNFAFVKTLSEAGANFPSGFAEVLEQVVVDFPRWASRCAESEHSLMWGYLANCRSGFELDLDFAREVLADLMETEITTTESGDQWVLSANDGSEGLSALFSRHVRRVSDTVKLMPAGEDVECVLHECPEAIGPFDLMRSRLRRGYQQTNPGEIAFFIQRFLRREFKIGYKGKTKQEVIELSEMINRLFYGEQPSLSFRHSGVTTPDYLQLRKLIGALCQKLADVQGDYPEAGFVDLENLEHAEICAAIGYYLLFRFCGVFGVSYLWISSASSGSVPDPYLSPVTFVRPTRSIDPSYLAVRSFGVIGQIPGINYIFRGALLPRLRSGRTLVINGPPGAGKTALALQKLVGVASRGGIAAYCSFEERYELIVDRLISFGFLDETKFFVVDLAKERSLRGEKSGLEAVQQILDSCDANDDDRGLLILFSDERHEGTLDSSVRLVSELRSPTRTRAWRAVAIDSIDAVMLSVGREKPSREEMERAVLRNLTNEIENRNLLGIIISEESDERFSVLQFLADTYIRLWTSRKGRCRFIEVTKCRSQSYHAGPHPFLIIRGEGLRIYPSVSAVRSTLREKQRVQLGDTTYMLPPHGVEVEGGRSVGFAEHSTILFHGQPNSGKTKLALQMALASSEDLASRRSIYDRAPVNSVLVFTFRTNEHLFRREISSDKDVAPLWDQLEYSRVRWYSAGENITAAQVVAGLRNELKRARRQGRPVQRVIFDELEAAEINLPALRDEPLFWSTVVDLLAAENLTTFLIFGSKRVTHLSRILELEADYVLEVRRPKPGKSKVFIRRQPELGL